MVNDAAQTELLRWIPALPLLAALIHGLWLSLVRRPFSRSLVIALSCGSVIASFGLSCLALVQLIQRPEAERLVFDFCVEEIFTKPGQQDYQAEITQLRAKNPKAVFVFYPGGMGVQFVR